ncbi:MAG: MaoC family dehydratase [Burkholderiales bacterium]|nr:MaoC family dehydratase [Burkholderiales bacterium]
MKSNAQVIEVTDPHALAQRIGQILGTSPWITVTQKRIDEFAEATGDRQWIHIDPERAARESPFGATIAHGFLTLSLIPFMKAQTIDYGPIRMAINYGTNRVRFVTPVRAGSRLRSVFRLLAVEPVAGGLQTVTEATVEIEGETKPACVAELITRLYL